MRTRNYLTALSFSLIAAGAFGFTTSLSGCGSSNNNNPTGPNNTAGAGGATQAGAGGTTTAGAGGTTTAGAGGDAGASAQGGNSVGQGGSSAGGATQACIASDGMPDQVHEVAGVTVSTLAGSGTPGSLDGVGANAQFSNPVNDTVDVAGKVFVADFDSGHIRAITPDGTVKTLTTQTIPKPFGLTVAQGALYVGTDADSTGTKDATSGTIWRINLTTGAATAVVQHLGRPRGLATLPDGRVVISDHKQNKLLLMNVTINPPTVTDLAGSSTGDAGCADGTGTGARFDGPYGVAITHDGNILVVDSNNERIRLVTPAGVVTTFAGSGTKGHRDDVKAHAHFNFPEGIATDTAGNVYLTESGLNDNGTPIGNHVIRHIDASGNVQTVAGNGMLGFADGSGQNAKFFGQEGIAISPDGKTLYVADGTGGLDNPGPYQRIRKITLP